MENKTVRHLNKKQMTEVFVKKRSKYYQQEGYKYALNISNAFLLERIFAFAFDTCIMFFPIILWEFCILLMFIGILPVGLLNALQIVTFILLTISIFCANAILSMKSGGQTLGKYFYDLKVVKKNHREAARIKLIARELIGFSLPTYILFLFFNIFGVIAYWIVDFLFLLIHPMHISIIDLFLGTRIVVLCQKKREPVAISETQTVAQTTIDLHLHSNFSDDGQYNVEELFQMAVRKGMRTIAICDHNSVKANLVAKQMADLYHVQYIPGAEFDCRYKDLHLRVLGYFINSSSDIFMHLENESLKREKNASLRRVEAFRQFSGISVDVDALLAKNRFQKISGAMIAEQVLKNDALKDHPMIAPYVYGEKSQAGIRQMDQDFFQKGAPCYVEVRHPKLEDILDIIHLTGGVAVLAWAKEVWDQGTDVFEAIIAKGIEGIEVFTPQYTTKDMAILLKAAKAQQLFVTCGSDFHGYRNPDIEIGDTLCPPEAEKLVKEFLEVYQG